jgi:hypothetical protein
LAEFALVISSGSEKNKQVSEWKSKFVVRKLKLDLVRRVGFGTTTEKVFAESSLRRLRGRL